MSHDVDFLTNRWWGAALQAGRTVCRHLIRERRASDAARAFAGWLGAMAQGRDPFSDLAGIIRRERDVGVKSSFQVAVARRAKQDVAYDVDEWWARERLRPIVEEGADLCLHGSYRSTEKRDWYVSEVAILERVLGRPLGSRQHYLSFDYDLLYEAQEEAGILYDMSMGYPDRIGPRAGFSFPYFPYNLKEDRPFRVLEISLFLMDVTLRTYMGLKGRLASSAIAMQLEDLRQKRGCASVVWHPIVFGGARDPGSEEQYWGLVDAVRRMGGVATDGRTVNGFWRRHCVNYESLREAALFGTDLPNVAGP